MIAAQTCVAAPACMDLNGKAPVFLASEEDDERDFTRSVISFIRSGVRCLPSSVRITPGWTAKL